MQTLKKTHTSRNRLPPLLIVSVLLLSTAIAAPVFAQDRSPFNDQSVTSNHTAGSAFVAGQPTPDSIASAAALDNLTDEERELLRLKLLPELYPQLKSVWTADPSIVQALRLSGLDGAKTLARSRYPRAKKNQFSPQFGNPERMLAWGRRYRPDAKMIAMIGQMKRGDMILTQPMKKEWRDGNMVCVLTKGAFHHALIVVDGPPPIFIEAIGITGSKDDTTINQVRYSTWFESFSGYEAIRLIRPTAGLPADQASQAVAKAIAYATAQIGKPYDYSFTDRDGQRAFYCSELVYKAYSEGAGLKNFLPDKSPQRDQMIIALHDLLDSLKPKDRLAMSNRIVDFTGEFQRQSPPDLRKLNTFIVDEVVPGCEVFSKVFPTPEARERLRKVLNKLVDNTAFPRFMKAQQQFQADQKNGKFSGSFGGLHRTLAQARFATSVVGDINQLIGETGSNWFAMSSLLFKVAAPVYRNLGTYSDFLKGQGGVPASGGTRTLTQVLDWAAGARENLRQIPGGSIIANLLPGKGDNKIKTDFTSPTDLAEAKTSFRMDWP